MDLLQENDLLKLPDSLAEAWAALLQSLLILQNLQLREPLLISKIFLIVEMDQCAQTRHSCMNRITLHPFAFWILSWGWMELINNFKGGKGYASLPCELEMPLSWGRKGKSFRVVYSKYGTKRLYYNTLPPDISRRWPIIIKSYN